MKRARENALNIALEKSAQMILKERRYESNTKRHAEIQKMEEEYRKDKFMTL